ncbi:unnamed protein product, partial [Closterium sp. NIES-53]
QLREWYAGRGRSGGVGPCTYVLRTGGRRGETCRLPHTAQHCFGRLTDAWRAQFPDAVELPRWGDLLRQNVAIFDLDFDAILAAMYAVTDSAEGDCYLCVPPDPGIEAAALGASASAAPGTGESAAPGTSESAALGAGEPALSGTAPTEALHTFTLDSGASRSFFRDSTTLTPLSRPVAVSLADPSGGPVLAHSSTVLPCLAAPSGLLSGLHLPSFSTNLVSGADLQDAVFPCSCLPLSHETLLWHHRLGHPSLPRLRGMASRTLVSGLPRSLPPLPPRPTPTCVPCVEDWQRAAPHSSEFLPTEAPLKGEVTEVLIDWIRGACRQLSESFGSDLPVLRLHSDRGGEFSSDLLRAFYRAEGIRQTFTLPASPQENGIAERCIGMVMDVARTSMIHAAAPHFLWPFAVQYAAHQINLQPRVSLPETTPTLQWTGMVGDASVFRVWGSRAFVRNASADKLSSRAVPCVFLGFPPDAPGWQFYHPTSRRVLSSQDVTFDKSVSYYRLFPYRTAPLPPPPLFLAPGAPLVDPLPPQGRAPSGVSHVDPVEPVEVAIDSGAARGAEPEGAEPGGTELERVESGGAEPGGAESWGVSQVDPVEPVEVAVDSRPAAGVEPGGAEPGGAESRGAESGGAEPERAERCLRAAGAAGPTTGGASGVGAAGGAAGAATAGGAAGAGAAGAAGPRGTGAGGTGTVGSSAGVGAAGGAGAAGPGGAPTGGTRAAGAGGTAGVGAVGVGAVTTGGTAGAGAVGGTRAGGAAGVVAGDPGAEGTGLTERREPESRLASPESCPESRVRPVRTGHRVPRQRPPPVLGSHSMTQRPSTAPHRVPLPSPPASSLFALANPESDSLRTASPTVMRLLATCFAAAIPHLVSMLLAPEGDPDAPEIPTPRSYAEAIEGPYSSQWQAAMDAEMASWKSTGTYVDEVPPPGVNIFSGMWIFRGVDFFQTFSPTPKMTTLRVLLHVAVQCDYELDSLDFSTAFLRGSLHEEIWLRRPPGFIGTSLAALGFAPPTADPSLFLRTDATLPPFYVLLYVDDLVFATADTEALAYVKSELQKRHTCTDLEPSGPYPELVGCLMYLMTCTRPDLAFPLSLLAHYVAPGRHRKVHWDAAKRVLRYLCSTMGMGLVLGGRARVVLTGHADASWVDDLAMQRSSQGYTFSLGSGSVSWRSTRSSSVLSSSCEAEIYAGAMAAQDLRWLTYLLTDLGEAPRSPPVLYVDNKAMLALCQEHRLEHRTKHIALRYFLARELQQRGQLRLVYVASRANTADVFTKAF